MKRGLTLAAAVLGLAALDGTARAELTGSVAPDFVLKSVSGRNFRLSEYRGQVVLLSFWASWCGECRSQLERLGAVYDRYDGSGLEMLAVSLDRDLRDVGDAARALGFAFPALHDAGGEIGEEYDVGKMPYVLLIDRDGVVREEFVGFSRGDEDVYVERVRTLLGE